MTFGGFLWGLVMMVGGFLMVWKTNWFLDNMGDIGSLLGSSQSWLSWKAVGVAFMFIGFMVAFGLFGLFFSLIFGRLFFFGGGL